jgi:hypothetical protein
MHDSAYSKVLCRVQVPVPYWLVTSLTQRSSPPTCARPAPHNSWITCWDPDEAAFVAGGMIRVASN